MNQTLYIATDLTEKNWLKYILEEFIRINKACFKIEAIDSKKAGDMEGARILRYTRDYAGGVSIVNRAGALPNKGIDIISKELFFVKGTGTEDTRFVERKDLFWNAFVFLSRLEEYLAEKNRDKIKSYSFNHPRIHKDTFDIPVVNNIFNRLESLVTEYFPDLPFGQKEKPVIELSHDVDYLNKTFQLRIRQTIFNLSNSLKCMTKPVEFMKGISRAARFFCLNAEYWHFDYWRDVESKNGKKSVFYVYAAIKRRKNPISWFIDPSYDLVKNKKFQLKLKDLIADGFEIGLHGSYESAMNKTLLSAEKESLESILGIKIRKVRQHWLRYSENITPHIHNALFESDSTMGWNDRIGFRAGCASKYRPYNHQAKEAFDFFEVPLVVMDSNIYCYGWQRREEIMDRVLAIFEKLPGHKTAHVSICWHQRACSSDYDWVGMYKEILKYS